MKKYNILWIDDEFEKINKLMERCEVMHDFNITKCRYANEGVEIFAKNIEIWSAVVLDAWGLVDENSQTLGLDGLRKSRDKIIELSTKRKVPVFIFTGQPGLVSDDTFKFMVGEYYVKGTDDDRLIEDIIIAADNQIETQIRAKYADALSVFPEKENELVSILKVVEQDETKNSEVMNSVRKILEFLCKILYERGIIEQKFKKSNISECSRDLGSSELNDFVPEYIQRSFHLCCSLTNEASHGDKFDQRIKIGEAPYAAKSTIYCLLNILQWCKNLPRIEDAEQVRDIISKRRQEIREEERRKFR